MVRVMFLAFAAITAFITTGVVASPSDRRAADVPWDRFTILKRGCGTEECCEAGCGAIGGGAGPDECCAYGISQCCGIGDGSSGGGSGGQGPCGEECGNTPPNQQPGGGNDPGDDGGDD